VRKGGPVFRDSLNDPLQPDLTSNCREKAMLPTRRLRLRQRLFSACTPLFPLLLQLLAAHSDAADAPKKFKILDPFNTIDPKTVGVQDIVAKPVSTGDPVHKKALELVADFAKQESYPNISKKLQPNLLSSKKYSGIHLWYRSNSETQTWISLSGPARKDGRPTDFIFKLLGKPEWQEATLDFSQFKNYEIKAWDKASNAQKVYPGGESLKDDDLELIQRLTLSTHVSVRGTSVKSHFQIADLGLIEK
jgi:hypothetical protein